MINEEIEKKVFDMLVNSDYVKSLCESLDLDFEEAEEIISKGRKLLGLPSEK